jgi:microcystin degradation protein MlrC
MHLFTASLGTETNTFSPIPTGARLFAETSLVRGGDYGANPNLFALPMIEWRGRARARGWRVTESLCTFAVPAGLTVQRVYEAFRDEILEDLGKAMPVDAVLLSLHGAMVADATPSCETDLVERIRAVVGRKVPIGVELDLHCHLTDELVAASTAIVIFKEYPHVDVRERAAELFGIVAAAVEGRVAPRMALFDCRMLGLYPTPIEPMASFVRKIKGLEGRDGVLSISIAHGFPWGDVPQAGTRVLVVTDGGVRSNGADGAALARTLGLELRGLRERIEAPWMPLDQALDKAMAMPEGPIVLADMADNAGGGAPSDATFILRAMLERGMGDAVLGCIWDAGAVALAFEAGEGARLKLRVGGKLGPISGDPLDLDVTVTRLARQAMQDYLGARNGMGDCWPAARRCPLLGAQRKCRDWSGTYRLCALTRMYGPAVRRKRNR